jgi:hypothetical protein
MTIEHRERVDRTKRIPLGDTGVTLRVLPADEASDEQLGAMIEILRRAFNGGPRWFGLAVEPIDHLRWKTRDFPGTCEIVLLERGTELVGTHVNMLHRFRLGGRTWVARAGGDSGLDPALQGRGINSIKVRWQFTNEHPETEWRFGIISHPAGLPHDMRDGTKPIGNALCRYVLPLDARRIAAELSEERAAEAGPSRTQQVLLGRARRAPGPEWARAARWRVRSLALRLRHRRGDLDTSGVALTSVPRADERFDAFFENAAQGFELIQERTAAYLNWRYCDQRAGPFLLRAAEERGAIAGYAALGLRDPHVELADLLALPGRLDVAAALLDDCVRVARERRASAVHCWLPRRHPYGALLRSAGFLSRPVTFTAAYSSLTPEAPELAFLDEPDARVHVMLGDFDHV